MALICGAVSRCNVGLLIGRLVMIVLMGVMQPSAFASSWNQPSGAGLVIVDYTLAGGARYFNGEGRLSPAAAYDKGEGFAYVEYGLTVWLLAVAKPEGGAVALAPPAGGQTSKGSARYVGLGTTDIGAQVQVAAFGPAVLAAQASFRLPATTSQANPALVGSTSRDVDLRALGGVSVVVLGWPAFVDVQSAYRIRSGGAPDEWHGDVTLGIRPMPRLMLLLQSATCVPLGRGTAWFPATLYSKLGGSIVIDLTTHWSIEAGMFQTLAGINALRERGYRTAIWYRF